MHFLKTQRCLVFSLVFVSLTLLTVPRPTIVNAQAGSCSTGLGFKSAREYTVGRLATVLASSDLNQDGVPDLVVGYAGDGNGTRLTVLLGNGQGEIAKLIDYRFNGTPRDLLLGDFNNDGKVDLVALGVTIMQPGPPVTFATGLALALGNGDGTFGELNPYEAGRDAAALASADFNRDGKLDLAVADRSGGNLVILLGKGDGGFNTSVAYKSGAGILPTPVAVAAADFNQDGKPDVVVANQNERSVSVFLNNGSGGFGTPNNIAVSDCSNLLVGDFVGDGQPDVVIGGTFALISLRGDGAGGFAAPTQQLLGNAYINTTLPAALTKGDFNGDGKLDVAYVGAPGITIMLNDGMGGYTVRSFAAKRGTVAIAANDFNRDDKLDLVATNSESGTVTMLLNADAADFRGMKTARLSGFVNGFNAADLNGDAKPELVTYEGNTLYIGTGNGAGEFSNVMRYDGSHKIFGTVAASVVADFTGDGNVDLAVLNGASVANPMDVVTLLPDVGAVATNTTAYFNRTKTFNVGTRAVDLVAADFNGDRRPDLAVANSGSDDVAILLNNGGSFVKAATIGVGLDPRSLAAADFNGDGKPDLVVACRNTAGVFLLLGDGVGGFTVSGIGIGANPRSVVTGDFNRDGKADLIVPHNNSMYVSILLGTEQGSFAMTMTIDVGGRPSDLVVADFNGDTHLDFALTRFVQTSSEVFAEDRVLLFAGDGTGKFARATELPVPSATSLRAADFNNDGLKDLAIAAAPASGGQAVWIAFNTCNPPAATNAAVTVNAASYTGVAAAAEAIVSAFGTALSNDTFNAVGLPLPTKLGETQITVKDSKGVERLAPLFFVSPLQVNYQIPAGTAAGIATVTIRNGTEKLSTGTVLILPTAPGLFAANANGEGVAAAKAFRIKFPTNAESYEDIAQFDPILKKFIPRPIDVGFGLFPANDKVYLLLFGTGLRSRLSPDAVRVKIGNTELPVEYAGPQPEYVGLDQVNVLISNLRGVGEVDVTVIVDGKVSNAVRVHIQ